jgi:hypothetical protein
MTRLVICVFGCVTIPKYAEEIRTINRTWGSGGKILFFLGEERSHEFVGDQYIYLPGVKNDYLSASYKQFLGLKYVYEHFNPDFVHCCGTDTFVNIPKMLQLLTTYDPLDKLYIGGHGDSRDVLGKPYYFHSGGPGFVLSRACLQAIYPRCAILVDEWIKICVNAQNMIPWCDVAISYFLQTTIDDLKIVKIPGLVFIHCSHHGYPCHIGQVDMRDIVCCHNMSLRDSDEFYGILLKNNFWV